MLGDKYCELAAKYSALDQARLLRMRLTHSDVPECKSGGYMVSLPFEMVDVSTGVLVMKHSSLTSTFKG